MCSEKVPGLELQHIEEVGSWILVCLVGYFRSLSELGCEACVQGYFLLFQTVVVSSFVFLCPGEECHRGLEVAL